jgi:hypothetical protein
LRRKEQVPRRGFASTMGFLLLQGRYSAKLPPGQTGWRCQCLGCSLEGNRFEKVELVRLNPVGSNTQMSFI